MDIHPGAKLLPIDPDPDTAYSPIAGVAWDEDRPRRIDAHRHHRGQLISVIRGVATVGTRQGVWVAPPNRAIWIRRASSTGCGTLEPSPCAACFQPRSSTVRFRRSALDFTSMRSAESC